jgi:hypothetical protein
LAKVGESAAQLEVLGLQLLDAALLLIDPG